MATEVRNLPGCSADAAKGAALARKLCIARMGMGALTDSPAWVDLKWFAWACRMVQAGHLP